MRTSAFLPPKALWLLSMIVAGPVGCGGRADNPAPAAVARAPTVARTGQNACFDSGGDAIPCKGSGQDGELQAGAAWPHPRFVANGDTTITDAMTGLAWAPSGNVLAARDPRWEGTGANFDGTVTWQHALGYVSKLNAEHYLGHDDWRLPNFKELGTLLNYGEENSAAWLNAQGFTRVQDMDWYWSSTSFPLNPAYVWVVDLRFGYVHRFKKAEHHFVWPVRAGR